MSDNSTLLKSCRYYKGEDQNPFEGKDQNKSMLWFYESVWVNSCKSSVDDSIIGEYVKYGLGDFEKHDNIPISLKALLFNRYAKSSFSMASAVEPFKAFYRKYYS